MGKQQLFLRNHGLKASKISGKVQHFAESFSSSHRAELNDEDEDGMRMHKIQRLVG